jgi:hypothetical protein
MQVLRLPRQWRVRRRRLRRWCHLPERWSVAMWLRAWLRLGTQLQGSVGEQRGQRREGGHSTILLQVGRNESMGWPLQAGLTLFNYFGDQLSDSLLGLLKDAFPLVSCPVVLPPLPVDDPCVAFQVAISLKAVQGWVQCAGANIVAMPGQFLGYLDTEDGLSGGMVENVYLDEAEEEVSLQHTIRWRYCSPISFYFATLRRSIAPRGSARNLLQATPFCGAGRAFGKEKAFWGETL